MKAPFGRLVALDDQLRTEHSFLGADDCCQCLADYLPGRGYRANPVNQLIVNLKCPPSIASIDPRRRHYKRRAVETTARAWRAAVDRSSAECATWIPIPTSRPMHDPNNPGFIYQRFQRGIMHYDKGCGCTQGLLLADYVKALITEFTPLAGDRKYGEDEAMIAGFGQERAADDIA